MTPETTGQGAGLELEENKLDEEYVLELENPDEKLLDEPLAPDDWLLDDSLPCELRLLPDDSELALLADARLLAEDWELDELAAGKLLVEEELLDEFMRDLPTQHEKRPSRAPTPHLIHRGFSIAVITKWQYLVHIKTLAAVVHIRGCCRLHGAGRSSAGGRFEQVSDVLVSPQEADRSRLASVQQS